MSRLTPAQAASGHPAYVGRVTVFVPGEPQTIISNASFNGTNIVGIAPDPLHTNDSLDAKWGRKLDGLRTEFGSGTGDRILSTDGLDDHRAVFYKYNATDPVAPDTLVVYDVWTEVGDKLLQISVTAGYDERAAIIDHARKVLHALAPPTGPVDGGVLAVPDAYLRLKPYIGESADGVVRFNNGYDLHVTTDVLKRPKPLIPGPDLLRTNMDGLTITRLEAGGANAGPLRGTAAAVELRDNSTGKQSYVAHFQFPGVDAGDPLRPTVDLELHCDMSKRPTNSSDFLRVWHDILTNFTVRSR